MKAKEKVEKARVLAEEKSAEREFQQNTRKVGEAE